jgi:hypothetical protein
MIAVKGQLNGRVAEILSAIERRTKLGQHVNIDFVDPVGKVTPLLMAIERGSDKSVGSLLKSRAALAVPSTRPAIVAAARTGQCDISLRLLDDGRCDVQDVLEALGVLNDRFEDVPHLVNALDSMLRDIYRQAQAPSCLAEVQSKLIDLTTRAKASKIFGRIVECGLIDGQTRDSEGKTLSQRLVHVPFRLHQLREICPRNFSAEEPLLRELLLCLCSDDPLPICRIIGLGNLPTLRPNGDFSVEPEFGQDIIQSIPKGQFNDPELFSSILKDRKLDFARDLLARPEAHAGQRTALEPMELLGLLPWGVATRRTDVVQILLKMGAPTHGYTVVPFDLEEQTKTPHESGGACLDAVQLAAWMGVSEVLKVLLQAGLDPNSTPANLYMRSPTSQITPCTERRGLDEIVSLLMGDTRGVRGLERYRDRTKHNTSDKLRKRFPKARSRFTQREITRTALQFAVENHFTDIVRPLLDQDAQVHDLSLLYARGEELVDITDLLRGASPGHDAGNAYSDWLLRLIDL